MNKYLEGSLYLVLVMFVTMTMIYHFVPNNWLRNSVECYPVTSTFNSTKWWLGEYSSEETFRIVDCEHRLGRGIGFVD